MHFTIITPSYNMVNYLPDCCASIRDQAGPGVTVDHLVMDGGSTDGTVEWLTAQDGQRFSLDDPMPGDRAKPNGYRLYWVSEPDDGMYDAINKGWARATGEVLAWLNCDEQYLPGTLATVSRVFAARPNKDFAYGHALLIHPDKRLISFRTAVPLRRFYIRSIHLYIHSASLFVRRRIIDDGCRLDTSWRAAGDIEWLGRVLQNGYKGHRIRKALSAFTITGTNLAHSPLGQKDTKRRHQLKPWWAVTFYRPILWAYRLEKFFWGGYLPKVRVQYALYDHSETRRVWTAYGVGFRWKS